MPWRRRGDHPGTPALGRDLGQTDSLRRRFGDMSMERAREWAADRLMTCARALRPATPPGPAMGSWKDRWDRVWLTSSRVDAVYTGRPESEGTPGATYDVLADGAIDER